MNWVISPVLKDRDCLDGGSGTHPVDPSGGYQAQAYPLRGKACRILYRNAKSENAGAGLTLPPAKEVVLWR
jgi:hypothetical protein